MRHTATILRRHPKIVKAYNGTLGDEAWCRWPSCRRGFDWRRSASAKHG
ncbi:hypothetical protein P4133_21515 [Pseudomonas aeruginosa]|nr:hypothetical protein [Pseudomonas aeruginosa]